MGHAIFLPVENELGNCLLGKLTVNISHLQNIINRFLWLPLGGNGTGQTVLIHHASVKLPLATYMVNKLRIPGAGNITPIAPVKDKFRYRVLDKVGVDTALFNQNIQRIWRGPPLTGHGNLTAAPLLIACRLLPLTPNLFNIF